MEPFTVALFGEAERGDYKTAYFCKTLEQLVDLLGNPPPNSRGLHYAVQALLFHRNLIFFRVKEEGFSEQDYYSGVRLLRTQESMPKITAICLPGVGSSDIIEAMVPICVDFKSILIITEADLYDYLTLAA